jgi:hypothetical protein
VSDASTLCIACARCCDGTLFDRVPLLQDEAPPLPIVTRDTGARHLPQPCVALSAGACQCYAQRPRACRQFVCLLLTALQADEVSLPDALAVVANVPTGPERVEYLRFHFGRR